MRISFTCEALTYSFGMQNWDNMAQRAGAAIEWADEHPICIESWAPGLYSLFIASLIQVRFLLILCDRRTFEQERSTTSSSDDGKTTHRSRSWPKPPS